MTEHRATRVVYCDKCQRAILGVYVVDCASPRTRRYCRGCVPDARKVAWATP